MATEFYGTDNKVKVKEETGTLLPRRSSPDISQVDPVSYGRGPESNQHQNKLAGKHARTKATGYFIGEENGH